MPPLGPPGQPDDPLFVYGLLRPNQLAYPTIQRHVSRHKACTASGTLWLRDGLPLFRPNDVGRVLGDVLWFESDSAAAWAAVSALEPSTQYQWGQIDVRIGQDDVSVNVLLGSSPTVGVAGEPKEEWSAADDPVFIEGLREVRQLVLDVARDGVHSGPDTDELWHQFFRLQGAYLLLWSVVERYTALRFGPGLETGDRIRELNKDSAFHAAVVAAGAVPDTVVDSRNPAKKKRIGADGTGAAQYYYLIRSNLSHRGKSAWTDAALVYKAVTELHGTMRLLLSAQLPALADHIEPLHREEPDLRMDDLEDEES